MVTHYMPKDSNVLVKKFQCKVCHKFGHFTTVCYQKSHQPAHLVNMRKPKAQQLSVGTLYTHNDDDRSGSESTDTENSFCLQMKIHKTQISHPKVPKPVYLMANLAYHAYKSIIREISISRPGLTHVQM